MCMCMNIYIYIYIYVHVRARLQPVSCPEDVACNNDNNDNASYNNRLYF